MDSKIIFKLSLCSACASLLIIYGCATVDRQTQSNNFALKTSDGAYHSVKKGQTIYQIAKLYQTDIDTIIAANAITDCSKIEIGQKLFIPYRQEARLLDTGVSDFIWPLDGKIISGFGAVFDNSPSKGITLRSYKDMDVRAAKSGRVVLIHPALKGYGRTIIMSHDDNFYTIYTNLAQILVSQNQDVSQGTVIAKLVNDNSKPGSSLHFEIRKGSYARNPLYFLPLR